VEKSTIERGKQAVKAVFRKMEATSQRFSGGDPGGSPGEAPSPRPGEAPLAPATEGVVSPVPASAGPEAGALSPAPPPRPAPSDQEIDLTPYREVVSTVAGFLWRLRGGDDIANWVAAERIIRAALRESGRA